MIRRSLGHGARHKVAVRALAPGQSLATQEDAPAPLIELGTVPDVFTGGALVDHGAHPVLPQAGVTNPDFPCRFHHLLQQAVGDALFHIDPGEGGALLSGQAVG